MNKSDLIQELVDRASLSKLEAQNIVEIFLEEVASTLADRGRVEVRGFGTFSVREKAARVGRNPKTGTKIDIKGRVFPHFKPGKTLRGKCAELDGEDAGAPSNGSGPHTQVPNSASDYAAS